MPIWKEAKTRRMAREMCMEQDKGKKGGLREPSFKTSTNQTRLRERADEDPAK